MEVPPQPAQRQWPCHWHNRDGAQAAVPRRRPPLRLRETTPAADIGRKPAGRLEISALPGSQGGLGSLEDPGQLELDLEVRRIKLIRRFRGARPAGPALGSASGDSSKLG